MRSGFGTVLAVVVLAALAGVPPVHASDERHGPGVGSVVPPAEQVRPDFQPPAVPAPQPKADPLSNGIGIGAAVGAGVGLGLVGWAYAQCDACDAPEPGGMYALGAGMGAAIGAAVGLVIDATRKNTNQRVSIAGSVASTRSQVRVTVRW
jgi:hypothetical protein